MRAPVQQPRRWAVAAALVLAIPAAARPAAAEHVIATADGAVNVGYTQTTRSTFQADPMAEPGDIPKSSIGGFFTELRPGISFQSGAPRLLWTLGYQLSGNFIFGDERSTSYSNQANGALAAQLSKYTLLTLNGAIAQGGTSFLLGQRPAETGQPELRAAGNPNVVSATLAEALSWEVGKRLALRHSLAGALSTPQDDLGQYNGSLTGTLGLDRLFRRDNAGLEVRSIISWLRPQQEGASPYASLTNSVLVRWNHDFSWKWNGLATAGIEQVYTDTGSKPLGLLPSGSAVLRYSVGNTLGALELSHGSATNLQVGAVTLSDRITVRGVYTLSAEKLRALSFSAGFLHNQPLGEASALVAGSGDAIQGDAGFTTQVMKSVLVTARYTLAYQYGQGGGLGATLAHIALVGVTARYSNASKAERPRPLRGNRVDGSDGKPFPTGPAGEASRR